MKSEDYIKWKSNFDTLSGEDKIEDILFVINQYAKGSGGKAAESVFDSMVECLNKYVSEN